MLYVTMMELVQLEKLTLSCSNTRTGGYMVSQTCR